MSKQANVNFQQSIDQGDRLVPVNLRQSGDPGIQMLISNRVRKSPYWHLSVEAGCWKATVYNRMYHPRAYVRPEDGGAMEEYRALVNDVTLWNVAVERPIRVKGPDAEAFCNYVCTRDVTRVPTMMGRYVVLCDEQGHVLNDPVMLRVADDEFWFTISDSDLAYWFKGINHGLRYDVTIDEIDVSPLQVQGPKSEDLIADLVGEGVREVPYYGLMAATIEGAEVLISQTGFSGEKGYEVYAYDSTLHAETIWNAILDKGEKYDLKVIAPAHHRRIAAGILSYGQDLDHETNPFQCNLGHMVPKAKEADYIGRDALERTRELVSQGTPPFTHQLVGLKLGGRPIEDYAPDFWLVGHDADGDACGWITSPWYCPELGTNIAMAYVPVAAAALGTALVAWLPDEFLDIPGKPVDAVVCEMPFRASVNPSSRERAKAAGRDHAF
ncbi:glycine cleavage T C-terminal barrel domain-containing protein [Halomonas maura]|uniref:glycine cleavage T C-terminal barrel domain-containing protein n=1 Tax=Halomonas maura TaxID=117606 RepID=UPI0025B3F257|nr:glycine cleavage T C-terminal barrel domain-containing protein [Halomonas maura]MDN3557389.1 glycine cleavage T C-terminal barrel domain-containing protein [Halomonas maura]